MFFGVFLVFGILGTLGTRIFLDVSLTHPYRLVQGAAIAMIVAGYFVNNEKTHVWLSVSYVCIILVGQVLFRFLPGLSQ